MPQTWDKSCVFFVEKVYPYPHSSQTQKKVIKKDKPECAFVFLRMHGVVIGVRIRGDGLGYNLLSCGYVVSSPWWCCMCHRWHMHGNVYHEDRDDSSFRWLRGFVCEGCMIGLSWIGGGLIGLMMSWGDGWTPVLGRSYLLYPNSQETFEVCFPKKSWISKMVVFCHRKTWVWGSETFHEGMNLRW